MKESQAEGTERRVLQILKSEVPEIVAIDPGKLEVAVLSTDGLSRCSDDCQQDRDNCPDCDSGSLYRSPDQPSSEVRA